MKREKQYVRCERCNQLVSANWQRRHINTGCQVGVCTPDAIWSRIDRSGGEDACWKWNGTTDGCYGHVRPNGMETKVKVHVWVWNQINGSIPDGKEILHSCESRCCNPKHMRLGTRAENTQQTWNEGHLGHRYSDEDCLLIVALRRVFGLSRKDIAKLFAEYHMVPCTVTRICNRWGAAV